MRRRAGRPRSFAIPGKRARWSASLLLFGLLFPAPLLAQEGPSDADRAAAQVLFDEGRVLMDQARYDDACDKFAESMRLHEAIGTQLNLGLCNEKIGRFASAWIHFEEARARAAKAGQEDRVQIAEKYADALADRLSKIRIVVDDAPEGLTVERDGKAVGQAQWGLDVPIDGGEHTIVATAPGKKTWRKTIDVVAERDLIEVTIPELEDAPEPAPVPAPRPSAATTGPEGPDGTPYLVGGVVAGSLGVVGLGLGTAFGVLAMNKESASLDRCPEAPNGCTAEGVALRDEAFTFAHVSTAGFVVGGVGVATGLLLILLAPSADDETQDVALETIAPWIDPERGGGLGARWRW